MDTSPNPYDQFDARGDSGANPYDQFDSKRKSPIQMKQEEPLIPRRGFGRVLSGLDALDKGIYEAGGRATDVAAKHMSPEAAGAVGAFTNIGLNAIPMAFGGGEVKAAKEAVTSVKDATLAAAKAEGMKLTEWIVRKLNA